MSWSAPIEQSRNSARTQNPIRKIVDRIVPNPNHPKSCLKLSIGDPTLDGNLLPPAEAIEAICGAARGHKCDGYFPSVGCAEGRHAVAAFWNDNFAIAAQEAGMPAGIAATQTYATEDVVLASGASHALELAITALCDPGDVLLVPQPGFSLYAVICANRGINVLHYPLLPDRDWEVDVPALETLVAAHRAAHPADQAIRAIIVTNPSNPCGSNFTAQHVIDIAAATARMQVPIIADEIYAGMTFAGAKFVSFTNQTLSPALVAGGLAKQWVAPGWRLGWLLRHDPSEGKTLLANVWRGVVDVSAILIGPNALIQGALPTILAPGPEGAAHRRELNATLEAQAALCYEALVATKSLKPTKPQGAMYMLVRIPDVASIRPEFNIKDDVDFSARLMEAENVQVLPGTIFGIPGFVRIVFTKPPAQLREAVARMAAFADMITA